MTIRLRRSTDIQTTFTPFGSMRWLAGKEATSTDVTLGRVVIRPGRQNARHCHPDCQEVLYLLAGQLEHTVGEEKVTMVCGDTIVIPPGAHHNAKNTGTVDADMMVAYSSGERGYRPEQGPMGE